MAAPSFVNAGTGTVDIAGAFSHTCQASQAAGRVFIVQIVEDGADGNGVTGVTGTNINKLDGTSGWTLLANIADATTAVRQYIYIGRATSTSAPTLSGTADLYDVYIQSYQFSGVSTGTTAATVIENGTAGSTASSNGTGSAISDAGVTTLGADRLALNFVGVGDDNAVGAFTGMTGGTWAEAAAEFASATGTDACAQLQTATIASAGTINGGSYTMAAADPWVVIGFALKPTTYEQDITLGLLESTPALYAPTLSFPLKSITLDLLDASRALYAPTVLPAPVTATLPLLEQTGETTVTRGSQIVADDFSGTGSGSWPNADTGGAYTHDALSDATLDMTFNETSGRGTMTADISVISIGNSMLTGVSEADIDATLEFFPTGITDQAGGIVYRCGSAIVYLLRVIVVNTTTYRAQLFYQNQSNPIGNYKDLTVSVAQSVKMRVAAVGSAHKWKVWKSGDTEPTAWDQEITDSSNTSAGDIGVWGQDYDDSTVGFDDFNAWVATGFSSAPGAPALYAPTLEQVGGVSTQSITLGLLDSGPALYAPTVLPQPVTVTLGLLESTPALYAPTLVPTNTVVLGLLDAVRELYGPTLTPKNLVSLGLIDAAAALYAPTLTPKNTLSLDLLESTPAVYAPDLTLAPYPITLPLLDAGPELYAPTVVRLGGVQDISLDLLDAGAQLFAPTLTPQPVTLTVPLLDAGAALYAPSISGVNAVTLPLLDAGPALYAPTIIVDQFVTLPLLDAGAQLFAPTLVGNNTLSLGLLTSSSALYAPDLTLAPYPITLPLLDAGPALYEPTLVGGSVNVTLPLLDAVAELYAPTLMQDRFVTLPLLDAGAALYAPTIVPGPRTISLDLIDGARALYAPVLDTENTIVISLLDAGPALYAPTIVPQPVGITVPFLDAGAALYAPELAQTLVQGIVLPLIDGGADLFPPTVANAAAIITGYTRSSTGSVLPGCTVLVYRSSDDSYVGSTTSDPITGRYTVQVQPGVAYFLVAWSAAGVYGTTARDLEGV